MSILDQWLWPEFSDGMPLLPGIDVTPDLDREAVVSEVFIDHPEIVRVSEWQQHDTYPGFEDGPVNVWIQGWERPEEGL
jgi:hypothetical protein